MKSKIEILNLASKLFIQIRPNFLAGISRGLNDEELYLLISNSSTLVGISYEDTYSVLAYALYNSMNYNLMKHVGFKFPRRFEVFLAGKLAAYTLNVIINKEGYI